MMKKLVLALAIIFLFLLAGCTPSAYSIETETEPEFSLPYVIETEYGDIEISHIYVMQEETKYGYDGVVGIEFDLSNMTEEDRYWFDRDYYFYVSGESLPIASLDEEYIELYVELETDILSNDMKYIFYFIQENREPLDQKKLGLEIEINSSSNEDYEIIVDSLCSELDFVEELPKDVENAYLDEVLALYD